jgi:hypothetical protein
VKGVHLHPNSSSGLEDAVSMSSNIHRAVAHLALDIPAPFRFLVRPSTHLLITSRRLSKLSLKIAGLSHGSHLRFWLSFVFPYGPLSETKADAKRRSRQRYSISQEKFSRIKLAFTVFRDRGQWLEALTCTRIADDAPHDCSEDCLHCALYKVAELSDVIACRLHLRLRLLFVSHLRLWFIFVVLCDETQRYHLASVEGVFQEVGVSNFFPRRTVKSLKGDAPPYHFEDCLDYTIAELSHVSLVPSRT